jgi:hypothetical protein
MKLQRSEIVCDQCYREAPLQAVVTCETHAVDLCSTHMRMHFAAAECRLIPVQREATPLEQSLGEMEAAEKQPQTDFSKVKKFLRVAKGEEKATSDEVLKCLREDREVPPDIMRQLGPGKRVFLENWNRLCKKLKELIEKDAPKRKPRQRKRR